MRLLNVDTLKLSKFDDDEDVPLYAIASHRWARTEDEVSFEDIQKQQGKQKPGFKKIQGFCDFIKRLNIAADKPERSAESSKRQRRVRHKTIEWLWIDTCCIDQKNAVELAESINSMWTFYKKAYVCYAYLYDVWSLTDLAPSVWFQRGWTLQELVAPHVVVFLNKEWEAFGHKCGHNRCRVCRVQSLPTINFRLGQITKIPKTVLDDPHAISAVPVSERIKWVQGRDTKKMEDLAYCLLGICNVFMPLIYGERENAWTRLERELRAKYPECVNIERPSSLLERIDLDSTTTLTDRSADLLSGYENGRRCECSGRL